ncbi:unnamed protein product [Phytophthora fragariaefolia]|uniref:Unnamed protein product n=1 Tax=Phytophthora fragariaefolia TaxID=1490495 RepID=A0A9W6YBC6_9STRA|nr:unnamed protein product [Phytophthora fragariaefolia]
MGPIRSSSRKKPAAAAAATAVAASHDVDLVQLWWQLAAAGWKSKRPREIEREWLYSSPDKTHVFVGESAVVNFAFAAGLVRDSEEEEAVQEEEDALTSSPSRRRLQEVKDNANILQDGGVSCDYVNYSSGVSDDDGMCDDEVEPSCGQLSNDEDVLSDSDALEMDTPFLASLQVGNRVLSRAAVKDREEILRAMTWTPVSSEYESDTPAYPRLGSEEARALGELLDVWRSPILTLFYFMPKSLSVMIATETNSYGLQQV